MDPVGPSVSVGGGTPAGMLAPYGGSTEPAGWVFCYGQAISRTTYATLFAAIGTNFGIGDGSTTFNVPDARGRALFGRDDMGGVAANRLTNAISGVTGITLGASGGDQRVQTHNHTVTDGGHTHTVTDPGHPHTYTQAIGYAGGGSSGLLVTPQAPSVGTGSGFILSATTGITINNGTTGITIDNYGAGGSQNVPPALVVNWIIFIG
jgi:microcystin-dependent protein